MNLQEAFIAAGIPAPPARAKPSPSGYIRYGKNNCYWAKIFDGGAIFGDYSTGDSHSWFEDDNKPLDAEQIAKRKEKLAALKKEQQVEQATIYEETSVVALNQWNELSSEDVSPYLQRKQVEAYDIRFDDNTVVIPLYDIQGKLWSLQNIKNDGTKRFLYNGRKRGCFHTIGQINNDGTVFVTEGYATAASIHMATGNPVIVAFDAGNLEPVIEVIRGKYPDLEITIAADNDCWTSCNVGKEKAEAVAKKYGCKVALPIFKGTSTKPTDFNDLHCLEGLEAVREQLKEKDPEVSEELAKPKFELIPADEFMNQEPPEWIIEDVLPSADIVMVYGASGAGKSFFVLDMVAAIALGRAWHET